MNLTKQLKWVQYIIEIMNLVFWIQNFGKYKLTAQPLEKEGGIIKDNEIDELKRLWNTRT